MWTLLVTFHLLLLLLPVLKIQGGFIGGNCPEKEAAENDVSLSCSEDCQLAHNAVDGFCRSASTQDFNCYCTPPLSTPSPVRLQCADNSTKSLRRKYEELCNIDCICNHGCVSHHCDYENAACHCKRQNENPTENTLCPFENITEMVIYLNAMDIPNIQFNLPHNSQAFP